MTELSGLVWPVCVGFALGLLYFAGLWLTVRRLPKSHAPVRLIVISSLVRTASALGVFYLMLRRGWEDLLAALLGFVVARLLAVFATRGSRRPGEIDPEALP